MIDGSVARAAHAVRRPRGPARLVHAAALVVATLTTAFVPGCGSNEPPLPVISTLPDFEFTDQSGRPFASRSLDGKVWVGAFLFTRCTTICPMLTAQMVNFRRRLGASASSIPFVAFSVDPAHDTPEVLARFARERGATDGFTFLTGDASRIRALATDGFKVAIGEPTTSAGGQLDVLHAQHLMLVDGRGRLRGFYRTDAEGLDALERDLARVRDEPR